MGKLAAPVRADKEMMFTNRQLVALMWPLLLEQLLAITVGLADSLMVATVGDAAISAVSLVDSISNLMIYIFSAMALERIVAEGEVLRLCVLIAGEAAGIQVGGKALELLR